MSVHRRGAHLLVVAIVFAVLALLRQHDPASISATKWYRGFDWINSSLIAPPREGSRLTGLVRWGTKYTPFESERYAAPIAPKKKNYTRILVIPRTKDEDISWIARELPDLNVTVYVVNDPSSSLHSPKNKGHEVMIYLTYIIDHYDDLADVVVFMHAHRWTHHNNELLGYDAPQMIGRLSSAHIIQQGYVNLRCHWSPGCPEWLHPGNGDEFMEKQEEAVLVESWDELFPSEPLPATLAQPCCAQFALSRERIHSLPLSRFIFFRDWILRTPLNDYISGRIWEYSWQYLFTSQGVYCPAEHLCYCETFRLCFGGASELDNYRKLQRTKLEYESQINEMRQQAVLDGTERNENSHNISKTRSDHYAYLYRQVDALNKELASRKKGAFDRGDYLFGNVAA